MKAVEKGVNETVESLKKELVCLVEQYTELVPTKPSRRSDFAAQQKKMISGVVAVREYGEITFLYDSTCDTRSVDHLFKQFRQFRNGIARNYALVALTNSSIGVIDLFSGTVIADVALHGYTNWEIYIPEINHLLTTDNVGLHLKRADDVRIILAHLTGDLDDDFITWAHNEIAEWKKIAAQATALLGNDGFVSAVKTDSDPLENVLIRLNLSRVSGGILEVSEPDEKIVVVPWAPLSRSISYSLNAPGELTVIQEVTHKLKSIW